MEDGLKDGQDFNSKETVLSNKDVEVGVGGEFNYIHPDRKTRSVAVVTGIYADKATKELVVQYEDKIENPETRESHTVPLQDAWEMANRLQQNKDQHTYFMVRSHRTTPTGKENEDLWQLHGIIDANGKKRAMLIRPREQRGSKQGVHKVVNYEDLVRDNPPPEITT